MAQARIATMADDAARRLARMQEIVRRLGATPARATPQETRFAANVRADLIAAFVADKVAALTTEQIEVPGKHANLRPPRAVRSVRSRGRLKRSLVHSGGRSFAYDALLEVLERQRRPFRQITPSVLQYIKREMLMEYGTSGFTGGATRTLLRQSAETYLRVIVSDRLGGNKLWGIRVKPLTRKYSEWKTRAYPGRPIGFLTGELFNAAHEKLRVKWGR